MFTYREHTLRDKTTYIILFYVYTKHYLKKNIEGKSNKKYIYQNAPNCIILKKYLGGA